ncbi:putative ABC transporter permease protein [Gordonia hirsuta DSM 44140 = NBRC 16056]|uniref:Transport permease protein n=1 Tax=Gordonia hirsuta DSM 44140 = NBRC 16056 TaxID=1121927 RepID=L7L5N6_9ACTN|nr:ABC transporter permease [Gordonia hirsuta]GAC56450.1 putative ABC transporter permease protein [Gordonia hirsuta DSM 44140 = NBRC 16056]
MTAATVAAVPSMELGPPKGRINPLQQWWVLTVRGLLKVLRNGEFIFAFLSPALLAICFYLPLRKAVAEVATIDYAQYLMPIIMLQSAAFVASSAAMRSAMDGQEGVHTRFRVMPMPAVIPFLARSATNLVLLLVALACGLVTCLIMGWRPVSVEDGGAGVAGAAIAVALVGMIGMGLALCADGIGLVAKSPEATSQLVAFPTLILGMLSTGFIPLNQFPEWIRGFVQYQPISQVTKAMREALSGLLDWNRLAPTVWWSAGLFVVAAILLVIGTRRAVR